MGNMCGDLFEIILHLKAQDDRPMLALGYIAFSMHPPKHHGPSHEPTPPSILLVSPS